MTKISLIGAGGKMGVRLSDNFLKNPQYEVTYVEIGQAGITKLAERGIKATQTNDSVQEADVVILAVPDVAIGAISEVLIPQMKAGAVVLTLDPAAPLDGKIAHREDLGYVIAHPCRKTMTEIFDHRCALVNKNGVCHQCSELNGWFNPKQNQQEVLIKNDLVRGSKKYKREELYLLRTDLVKAIDPLRSKGAALQEILLHCNNLAMGEALNKG